MFIFPWFCADPKYEEKIYGKNILFSEKDHCIHYNSVIFSPPMNGHKIAFINIKSVDCVNFRNSQFVVAFQYIKTNRLECVFSVNYWINDLNAEESAETVDSDTCLSISDIEILKPSSSKSFIICFFALHGWFSSLGKWRKMI